MKYILPTMLICLLLLGSVSAQQLAFPTAEGFGRLASGGRGDGSTGYVCHVNTLSSATTGNQIGTGPHHEGSFSYCFVQRSGPRTIVFDVVGIIDYSAGTLLYTENPNVTIAGQTAPGDGVLIKGAEIGFHAPNGIVRHLRVRNGSPGPPLNAGSFAAGASAPVEFRGVAQDIIFDHCSGTWGNDDIAAVASGSNITYQWNIFGEGLSSGTPGAEPYSKPILTGDSQCSACGSTSISLLHNLMIHAWARTPALSGGDIQIINNVIYNVHSGSIMGPYTSALRVHYTDNYHHKGPHVGQSASPSMALVGPCFNDHPTCTYYSSVVNLVDWQQSYFDNTVIYVENNFHNTLRPTEASPENAFIVDNGGLDVKVTHTNPNFGFPAIPSQTLSGQAYTDVLANAGARVPNQDSIDVRHIAELTNKTQTYDWTTVTSVAGFGGYPTLTGTNRDASYDTDDDGIPDSWETLCGTTLGISPSDKDDGNNLHASGYSNLDIYINALAGDYGTDGVETCAQLLAQGDTTPPNVAITAPTSNPTYTTSTDPITTLAGTADDAVGVDSVTWANAATAGSGSATGCAGETSCSWSIASIALAEGDNVITVTATDAALNEGTDVITVTLDTTVALPGPPTALSTTAAPVPTFPGAPTGLSTTAATVPTLPGAPTSPSTTADPTVTFPGAPTGLSTP